MDFRKTLKSKSSYKQFTRSRSSGGNDHESEYKSNTENLPILHEHHRSHDHFLDPSLHRTTDPPGSIATLQRDPSYQFWQQPTEITAVDDATPQPTLENLLRSREGSGSFDFSSQGRALTATNYNSCSNSFNMGEIALDVVDPDVSEEQSNRNSSMARSSMALEPNREQHSVRWSGINLEGSGKSSSSSSSSSSGALRTSDVIELKEGDEVVRCTSNKSFHRKSELSLRAKMKSRLLDPPPHREEEQRHSGWQRRSDIRRSGLLGKPSDEEEDDPLADEDVPEEYKKRKLDALTLLEWLSLVLIIAALVCSLSIHPLKMVAVWNLNLWKWLVFLLALICGRLVSGWGIRIAVFFIERSFLLRKRVLYFVYGLRRGVQNCIWLGLVLLTWHLLFNKKVQRETRSKVLPYVTKILVCFLVGNILWLIKTLVVKVLASSFHVSTYFDRIQEALFNQYVIETLSGPPMIEMSKIGEDEVQAQEEMLKMQNAGANLPPELCAAVPSPGKSGRTLVNPKLSPMITKAGTDNGITMDDLEDLMRFLREDEAVKTMNLFEGASETRRISKSALKNWLVNAFRERRALALTLNDTKTAVNKLHQMINILSAIAISIICLIILEIASSRFLVLINSQVVLMAFMFGNTLKTIFESIIFLFFVHPYDVGDRCEIDGIQMVVEEMNILTTLFLRYDNLKILYPNSVLWQRAICNYYRSPDMGESVEFCVHIATPDGEPWLRNSSRSSQNSTSSTDFIPSTSMSKLCLQLSQREFRLTGHKILPREIN